MRDDGGGGEEDEEWPVEPGRELAKTAHELHGLVIVGSPTGVEQAKLCRSEGSSQLGL